MRKIIISSLFFINLSAIALLWWLKSGALFNFGTPESAIAMGRLFGLLAEFFILVELVLISRVPFIEKLYGFENLNRLHRKVGYCLGAGILFHPAFLIYGYAAGSKVSAAHQLIDFLQNWEDVFKAFLGLVLLVAVIFLALPAIRRKLRYETWHGTHLIMYVAIVLFFGHQINTADVSSGAALYYWLTLNFAVGGAVLAYRFVYPFFLFARHRFFVEKIVQESHNVYSVYISGRHMNRFVFEAGQYIHATFLTKGMRQPHPFSISVAPNGRYIRLSIKAVGDFTSRIKNLKADTKVLIEGPYGRFTEKAAHSQKFLMIAGGIGITPIRALVESLIKKEKDILLLYGNRGEEDIVFKKEIASFPLKAKYVLSKKESEIKTREYERGRIDIEKIERLAPDFLSRDIYICGPQSFINDLTRALRKALVPSRQIHFEKFSY